MTLDEETSLNSLGHLDILWLIEGEGKPKSIPWSKVAVRCHYAVVFGSPFFPSKTIVVCSRLVGKSSKKAISLASLATTRFPGT